MAFGKRYLLEAEISARSLKRFTQFPICVITDININSSGLFDKVMYSEPTYDFIAKAIGMQMTPFEQTVFLDTDTFVCSSIDNLFDLLQIFDMGLTVDNFIHSFSFIRKYRPDFIIPFENVIPEYNTGVVVYKNNVIVRKLINDWKELHKELRFKTDMPSFREAVIINADKLKITPIPFEYNYTGTNSLGFAYNEIKVIHERLGERWNTLTTVMLPFDKMERQARRMNRFTGKRIIIPYVGVIPYTWSPFRIKYQLKKFFGIKKSKKADTF